MEESRDWSRKSAARGLLTDEQIKHIVGELDKLPKAINQLVQYTNEKLKI